MSIIDRVDDNDGEWMESPQWSGPNYLRSMRETTRLADNINAYWRARGIDAGARAEKDHLKGQPEPIWTVQSNLTGHERDTLYRGQGVRG